MLGESDFLSEVLMTIKTKTLYCKGIRKEERNEVIVNCKFTNG